MSNSVLKQQPPPDPAAEASLVSAVIPTRNRPELVVRAVRSALGQTYGHLEVVVVIDGPDAATEKALEAVVDSRLRVVALPSSIGGSDARNAGAQAARGEWIAFLDDDDEWMPDKTERQMAIARRAECPYPIISCRQRACTPMGEYIWPRRLPGAGEPIGDYIFARRGLFQGEGAITTITLLIRRELLLRVPFRSGQRRHQEWDWLLRALQVEGAEVLFSEEVLAIWHAEEDRASVSATSDWRYSYDWIQSMRSFVTPRAYAAFLLILVTSLAVRGRDWKGCAFLLKESFRNGRPEAMQLALFSGMMLIPQPQRRRLRAFAARFSR